MMSKKPFDHIEDRIREAAVNSEPPFNEQAWHNMEALLDKDKRHRFFFWWRIGLPLLIAAIAACGWLIYNTTNAKTTTRSATAASGTSPKQNNPDLATQLQPAADTTLLKADYNPADIATAEDTKQNNLSNPTRNKPSLIEPPAESTIAGGVINIEQPEGSSSTGIKKGKAFRKKYHSRAKTTVNITADYGNALTGNVTEDTEQAATLNPTGKTAFDEQRVDNSIEDLPLASSFNKAGLDSTKKEEKKLITAVVDDSKTKEKGTKKVTGKKKAESRFYVLLSGGAELIKTKFLSYGNTSVSARFGAGIGYEISKHLSVQTGFYAGRKKYMGGGENYHPKQGSYWSMVNLKKVDGSCLIYDIPVSLRYNITSNPSQKIYGMAGLSSFIMKKEDYNYWYTYSNAPNTIHKKAYSYTGNKNLFSVLTLSAGIEKKISPVFFVLAEPYISLPLSGVGDGAVKLYSTGLQLGIKYKPKF